MTSESPGKPGLFIITSDATSFSIEKAANARLPPINRPRLIFLTRWTIGVTAPTRIGRRSLNWDYSDQGLTKAGAASVALAVAAVSGGTGPHFLYIRQHGRVIGLSGPAPSFQARSSEADLSQPPTKLPDRHPPPCPPNAVPRRPVWIRLASSSPAARQVCLAVGVQQVQPVG